MIWIANSMPVLKVAYRERHCPPIPDKRVGTENLTEKNPWLSYIREWILNIKKIPALSITLLCPLRISQKVSVHKRSKIFIWRFFFRRCKFNSYSRLYSSDEIRFCFWISEKWFHNHFVALVGCVDRDTHEFKPGGTDAIHDGLGRTWGYSFFWIFIIHWSSPVILSRVREQVS